MTLLYNEASSISNSQPFTHLLASLCRLLEGIWNVEDLAAELVFVLAPARSLRLWIFSMEGPTRSIEWATETGWTIQSCTQTRPSPSVIITAEEWTTPLITQGQWVGHLQVCTCQVSALVDSMGPCLPLIASAVQQQRLFGQAQQLMMERLLVQHLALSMQQNSDPESLLTLVCQQLKQQLSLFSLSFMSRCSVLSSRLANVVQADLPILWLPVQTPNNQQWGILGLQAEHWPTDCVTVLGQVTALLASRLHQATLMHNLQAKTEALGEALITLRQTQSQLIQSEKLAVIGQFVAGIAHEVNTPLGVVMSNQQLLSSQLETMLLDADSQVVIQTLLSLNQQACERIRQTVQNLKAFARVDAPTEKASIDVVAGVESTLAILLSSISPLIKVTIDKPEFCPESQGFSGLLNLVWMNLLVNALHAIGENAGQLCIRISQTHEAIMVIFEDTGCGIAPEHIPRLFDPGFTTKGPGVGTGLGLSLCYQIVVQRHGGDIKVASQPGMGSAFSVSLPRF